MVYFVTIETLQVVEIKANSEEEAIKTVRDQLNNQDPRNTANISIAKEIIV